MFVDVSESDRASIDAELRDWSLRHEGAVYINEEKLPLFEAMLSMVQEKRGMEDGVGVGSVAGYVVGKSTKTQYSLCTAGEYLTYMRWAVHHSHLCGCSMSKEDFRLLFCRAFSAGLLKGFAATETVVVLLSSVAESLKQFETIEDCVVVRVADGVACMVLGGDATGDILSVLGGVVDNVG